MSGLYFKVLLLKHTSRRKRESEGTTFPEKWPNLKANPEEERERENATYTKGGRERGIFPVTKRIRCCRRRLPS